MEERITREELLERLFHDDYENLKGKKLRLTRVRVPGKSLDFAHVITPSDPAVYQNLALNIGVHEGEDHAGGRGPVDGESVRWPERVGRGELQERGGGADRGAEEHVRRATERDLVERRGAVRAAGCHAGHGGRRPCAGCVWDEGVTSQ